MNHSLINRIRDDLLTAFDVHIDEEKENRTLALEADNPEENLYCNGRVDGVDTGRAIAETVMSKFDAEIKAIEWPMKWLSQLSKPLEEWEVKKGLTAEQRQQFVKLALDALCETLGSSAELFSVEVEVSDWRQGEKECVLTVELNHDSEWLDDGHIWLSLYVDESECVFMMVGEDGDEELDLNAKNLWSVAYLNAFCKPQ